MQLWKSRDDICYRNAAARGPALPVAARRDPDETAVSGSCHHVGGDVSRRVGQRAGLADPPPDPRCSFRRRRSERRGRRIIAQRLGELLGQQVVVENPSGAGGTLGSGRVAKAAPDGYQFVIGNIGTHAWSQALYRKPPYNTLTDFVALSLVVESPRALITPKSFPAGSLPEFIAHIKANQATAKFASAGAGSASHVSCILLNAALGVSITHVPYRGLGPAMQDLIAGRVDYMCDSPSTSLPQIETDMVKAIATTGQRRATSLPKVPTAKEQGLDFDVTTWQGLFLPKGTPEPIVRRLNQAVGETLDSPSVRERF